MFGMQNVTAKQAVITSVAAVLALFLVKSTAQNNIARTGHWHGMGKPIVHSEFVTRAELSTVNGRITATEDYQRRADMAFTATERRLRALEETQLRMGTAIGANADRVGALEAAQGHMGTALRELNGRVNGVEIGLGSTTRVADATTAAVAEARGILTANVLPRLAQVEIAASTDPDADAAKGRVTAMIAAEKQRVAEETAKREAAKIQAAQHGAPEHHDGAAAAK